METEKNADILKSKIKGGFFLHDFLLYTAVFFLLTIVISTSMTAILWFFGVGVTIFHLPVALVLSSVIVGLTVLYFNRDKKIFALKLFILVIIFSVLFLFMSCFVASRNFDYSFDSMAYHKLAVGLMSDGWNPVYENSADFVTRTGTFYNMIPDVQSLWLDHYAKITWIFSALIYKITGNIETSKILPIIMLYVTFAIGYIFCSKRNWNKIVACIFSLFSALTPIVFTQLLTFYVDGVLASCLTCVCFLLLIISDEKNDLPTLLKYGCLALVISIIANIKFTGLAYAGAFSIAFYLFWIVRDVLKKKFCLKKLICVTSFFATVVIFSVGVIGFSSYVRNQVDHNNFLYPLMGEGKVDIMTDNQPDSFAHRSTLGKLFLSTFGRVSNVVKDEPTLKIPFTSIDTETHHYCSDTRISGFGVYFSGLFVISCVVLMYVLPLLLYKDREKFALSVVILTVIVVLLLGISDSWWARYSPHMYFIPLIAIFLLIDSHKAVADSLMKNLMRIGGIAVTVIIALNIGTYFWTYANHFDVTRDEIREGLETTESELFGKSIDVYIVNRYYVGALYNLRDMGIDFTVSRSEIDGESLPLRYMNMIYKFSDNDE